MLAFLWIGLFFLVLIGFNYNFRTRKRLHGPKGYFLIGNALDMLVTPDKGFTLCRNYAKLFKDAYSFNIFNILIINIFTPEDIKSVIASSKNNDKSFFYYFLRPWLGDGILLSKGKKWQERRKILTPTFHFSILDHFCSSIDEATKRMLISLRDKVDKPIEVMPIIGEYTLFTTCATAMGTRLNNSCQQWKSYKKAIHNLGYILYERITNAHMYLDFIHYFTENFRRQRSNLQVINKFSNDIIMDRKRTMRIGAESEKINIFKNKNTAMLDLLIAAEDKSLIDEPGIREEVNTFIFAGHDTTSIGIDFCLMLLANNPHAQDKIIKELDEIYEGSPRALTLEDLSKMRYLECCIKETLRLYPPVHIINRVINEETIIAGHNFPAGTLCDIHIFDLHHREELFPNPEQFNPDRFLPKNCANRHPFAYIPFSAGPRNCIGQRFAMMVMKSALSAILQRYKLLPVTRPEDIVLLMDIVLRTKTPIKVTFVERVK